MEAREAKEKAGKRQPEQQVDVDMTEDAAEDAGYEEKGCGSCYGAGQEGECCDTCDDVKRAYTLKGWHVQNQDSIEQCKKEKNTQEAEDEGCNVHGLVALDSGGE